MEELRILRYSSAKLLVLYGSSLSKGHPNQAKIQENMLLGVGSIDHKSILRLDIPITTACEAEAFRKIFGNKSPILVTKAIHMQRAYLTFKKLGINPIPAPCNYIFKTREISWIKFLIPAFSHAPYLGELLKEGFGIFYMILKPNNVLKPVFSKA